MPDAKKPDPKKPAPKPTEPFVVKTFNEKVQLCVARFSPCGKFVIGGGTMGGVFRWDAATDDFAELAPLSGHGGFVQCLAFNRSGKLLTADSWGRLQAWNYADAAPKPLWNVAAAHDGWVREVVISPDGKTAASCGRDGFIRLWDVASGKPAGELPRQESDVFALAFSPDGKQLVSGDLFGRAILWDLAGKKIVGEFDAKALAKVDRLQDVGGVRLLRFTPDGKQLLVGGTQPKNGGNVQGTPTVLTFEVATGKAAPLTDFGSGYVYICDLQFMPDGGRAVVLSGNPGSGKFALYKPGEAKPYFESTKFANCHSVDVHPAGKRLAVLGVNSNTSGNGRVKGKNGEMDYPSNWSPINIVELPDPNPTA